MNQHLVSIIAQTKPSKTVNTWDELNHGKSYRKGPLNHNGATKDLVES
jgi:hypothetical protein